MYTKIGLAALLTVLSGVACAAPETCRINTSFGISVRECTAAGVTAPKPTAAPELDSGSAITGAALALGGLVVLRGRRLMSQKN